MNSLVIFLLVFAYIHGVPLGFPNTYFYVYALLIFSRCQSNTVLHAFSGDEIRRSCWYFFWIVNQVSAGRYTNLVGVIFLWAVIDNNPCICDGSIFSYFILAHEK